MRESLLERGRRLGHDVEEHDGDYFFSVGESSLFVTAEFFERMLLRRGVSESTARPEGRVMSQMNNQQTQRRAILERHKDRYRAIGRCMVNITIGMRALARGIPSDFMIPLYLLQQARDELEDAGLEDTETYRAICRISDEEKEGPA